MLKEKRLIDVFKKQTKRTIWKHLDTMAKEAIYSTHLTSFEPHLKDFDIYMYADFKDLVVVCVDNYKYGEKGEIATEEGEEESLYITNDGILRTSPAWQLYEAMRLMTYRLRYEMFYVDVYGMLLTNSKISNFQEVEQIWKDMDIKVIDGIKNIESRSIEVNEDRKQLGRLIVDTLLQPTKAELETAAEKASKDEEEKPSTGNDFPVEEIDFDNHPDLNGEIQQNQNVSVKVNILRPIDNPYEELNKLVGCADIKQRMDELVALTKYNKIMSEMFPDSKQHKVSLHSVFLGRPGTGKTTVCKIFGSLLRKAGALSKGHVVVCDRGTFIGTLWGDEERSVRQVLEIAQGGVLMIDEAYLLNGKHENDPGRLVIQLLMNILSDESQRDIAVVLCGYKEPMQKLIDSNPGLHSRFPNKFEFHDFTVDELLEITRRRVDEYKYDFTPAAWEKYCQILSMAYQQRNPQTWGNARFIANQLERIYTQHAYRCVKQCPPDKLQMLMLTPEDILPIEVPKERKRIGF